MVTMPRFNSSQTYLWVLKIRLLARIFQNPNAEYPAVDADGVGFSSPLLTRILWFKEAHVEHVGSIKHTAVFYRDRHI
jgi:hypothetical protein